MTRFPILAAVIGLMAGPVLAFGGDTATTTPGADDLVQSAQTALDAAQYDAAITDLQAALAAQPGNADILNLLGFANRKAGHLDVAGGFYAQALAADPAHLGALEYQGELFILQGDRDAALANLARLTELCGTCEEATALSTALSAAGLDGAAFGDS